MASVNLVTLRTEIQTDPAGLGYTRAPSGTRDQIVTALQTNAALINNRNQSGKTSLGVAQSYQLLNAIVGSELVALPAARLTALQIYLSAGSIDLGNSNVRAALQAIFAGATTTLANILNVQDRPQSRAEVVFSTPGIVIAYTDIGQALGV